MKTETSLDKWINALKFNETREISILGRQFTVMSTDTWDEIKKHYHITTKEIKVPL